MKLPWLLPHQPLPPVENALREPDGLLAVSADLSIERLQEAYTQGVFPWYTEKEPVLWWSPDPRMVLATQDFVVSHSLAKRLRQIARQEHHPHAPLQIRVDTAFDEVLEACAASRNGQPGTWLTHDLRRAYRAWHQIGVVHSIETWMNGQLCAGLYGVSLGSMFYGESMFTHIADGSKIALAYLVRFLINHCVPWIDCQQQTQHLASLGARPLPRPQFVARVQALVTRPAPPWMPGRLNQHGQLLPLADTLC